MTATFAIALALAPSGRDGAILASLLREVDMQMRECCDVAELAANLGEATSIVVLTEEAVRSADLRAISSWVEAQPSWSDLPFIVLTQRGGGPERNPAAARLLDVFGNVSFVERPFHPTTFLSVARTADRGRRRQYEARAQLEELRLGEQHLKRLAETLEERVAERTASLSRAHDDLVREVDQREEAERRLLQAQKMEAIGQLTGGVAHDFNNLLMAILGNLNMLEKRLPEADDRRRLIANARQGADRGVSLTKRMLAFARRQELDISPTDVSALLNGMRPLFENSLGPEIELVVDVRPELPHALIDANQVELALLNLVVNARDAMPEGGRISITADMPMVEGVDSPGMRECLRLIVGDNGEGMTKEVLAKAAEPFFSTKGIGKGTGLGLAMIHGLAEQMGGALRLASEVGVGTRAELWLPIATHVHGRLSTAERSLPVEVASAGTQRILVVDDDVLVAMNVEMMAEDLGHEAVIVNSAAEAIEALKKDSAFDVVITDYAMPKMTGAELARTI